MHAVDSDTNLHSPHMSVHSSAVSIMDQIKRVTIDFSAFYMLAQGSDRKRTKEGTWVRG